MSYVLIGGSLKMNNVPEERPQLKLPYNNDNSESEGNSETSE